jgi:hypothetical protein
VALALGLARQPAPDPELQKSHEILGELKSKWDNVMLSLTKLVSATPEVSSSLPSGAEVRGGILSFDIPSHASYPFCFFDIVSHLRRQPFSTLRTS